MYEVLTIGSALIDTFVHSQQFRVERGEAGELLCQLYGDKLEVESLVAHTGGGGSNTAVGFARMGFSTAVVTETGKDILATVIEADFSKEGVGTEYIVQEKKEQTGGSVILVSSEGGRSALVHRGASSLLDPQDIPAEAIQQATWVHLSSVSGRVGALQQVCSLLSGGKRRLSWNPGKQEIQALVSGELSLAAVPVEIFIVNDSEWRQLSPLHRQLLSHAPQIVITAGRQGGAVFEGGVHTTSFGSSQVESVDDTGAGDAFAVGYVSAYLTGQGLEDRVQWGVSNAGSVVAQVGAKAGLLHRETQTNRLQLPTSQTQ